MTGNEKRSLALSAYHDGELSPLGRWRIERKLRKSAALRDELAELERLSGAAREIESAPALLVTPDLWSEIGPALSAIDREVDGARNKTGSNPEGTRSRTRTGMIWGSLAASGALAALVLILVVDNRDVILEDSAQGRGVGEIVGGSLRYLQTNGISYVVSQDTEDVTIIWLMDAEGVAEGA